jgi:hypothetical protein
MFARALRLVSAALFISWLPAVFATDEAATLAQRWQLHMEQQQDALRLDLQQALGARRQDLSPGDARRLEQLQLHQRLEQQFLENQQLQRDLQLRHERATVSPDVRRERVELQRGVFAVERALQMQQFDLQQRRLIRSMPRRPLQPPIGNPQLRLP